jgi:hypothetical protein
LSRTPTCCYSYNSFSASCLLPSPAEGAAFRHRTGLKAQLYPEKFTAVENKNFRQPDNSIRGDDKLNGNNILPRSWLCTYRVKAQLRRSMCMELWGLRVEIAGKICTNGVHN